MEDERFPKVVQLDGLVLLKIIKHCKESMPEVVTGALLGLDRTSSKVVEITHTFPQPNDDDEEDYDYQNQMLKQLREVNVDCNTVGWYVSGILGAWFTPAIVDTQLSYQKEIPSSVMVVYDPIRTVNGKLFLKAYRLTKNFLALHDKGDFSQTSFAKQRVDSSEIFEEIPIKVHNSHLVHMFLYELREQNSMSCDLERLQLPNSKFLTKNLASLSNYIDEYTGEQSKYQFHQRQVLRQKQQLAAHTQRRDQENQQRQAMGQEALPEEDLSKNPLFKPIPEPGRLETYLCQAAMSSYCDQVTRTANEGFFKLYTVQAVMKPSSTN